MKKSWAIIYAPSLELPQMTKTLPNNFTNQKTIKQADELSNAVTHPTEEMINHLNRIGHEYPFCVYYKYKVNDPL